MARTYKQRQTRRVNHSWVPKESIDREWLRKQERKIRSGRVDIIQRALHSIEKHNAYLLIAPSMQEYLHIQFPFVEDQLMIIHPPCTNVHLIDMPSFGLCTGCPVTFCSKKME